MLTLTSLALVPGGIELDVSKNELNLTTGAETRMKQFLNTIMKARETFAHTRTSVRN